MKKLIISTLLATVLATSQALAYEPYGTDLSLQFGGGLSSLNVFDAGTLSRNTMLSMRNYDIQMQFFPSDHIGLYARHCLLSSPVNMESLYSNTTMTFGALYRINKDNWSFRAGAGLGFATPNDYSFIKRGPEGAAPEIVVAGNSAPQTLALSAQLQASYHINEVLYLFGNCSVFGCPGKNPVIARTFTSDESWSGAVRYLSGDIQTRDWQAKLCTDTKELMSGTGINPLLSIGIGFTFNK
ncbi:MAG: hypothetical protein MJY60_07040 [Bacteroidales bacterium]|nr:hypothetical protein [Bacteroidales bacterium]